MFNIVGPLCFDNKKWTEMYVLNLNESGHVFCSKITM